MTLLAVHKFGGTSVADAARLVDVVEIVRGQRRDAACVVVASAASGVTDALLEVARAAGRGDVAGCQQRVEALRARHLQTLTDLGGDGPTTAEIGRLLGEAHDVASGAARLGEMTARARDRLVSVGEKLSVRLLALAFRRAGVDAQAVDADTFVDTDGAFGEATPLGEVGERAIRVALQPLLDAGRLPVVTGFLGRAPDGATTTLGRGGSDLSATVLAAALHAAYVVLWSDVEGVLTADPRLVPEARVLTQLHYREAAELSFYGAKVLHPRTMIPVVGPGIPVWSRSTFTPDRPGTVVDGRFTPGSHPVKAISAVRGQALLSLEGKGMAGVPGVAARCFGALAERAISVTMISQSSSEASICLAVPEVDSLRAEQALKAAFRPDLARGLVEEVVVQRRVGLVAAVGLGMARTPGVSARIFGALGKRRVNVLAIAQGSSELNVSLAVDERDIEAALRALHAEFGLGLRDTGEDAPRAMDLLLLGAGGIGRALARLVGERGPHLRERFGVTLRVAGVADRSGYLFDPVGLAPERLEAALAAKAGKGALVDLPGAVATRDAADLLREALSYRLARPVVVDVSDADDSPRLFLEAFRLGADVVTANKKPLAGDAAVFRQLVEAAREGGRLLRAEATVGAGLPVIDTLEMLLGAGDRLIRAEGCLSGTLAFVVSRLEAGERFSDVVAEAARRGYTEPDPVVDLSGADVARKAVILGRVSGVAPDARVQLTGLVDPALAGRPLPDLLEALKAYDEPLAARVDDARTRGAVLRYLARVDADGIAVGLAEVPADSPFGGLRGTDNMIVFRTERYDERPLVISGPGAGVEVTAMGVLGDLMRTAAERR
jgi:aspartokinase/homoserine dehydrogenase 1